MEKRPGNLSASLSFARGFGEASSSINTREVMAAEPLLPDRHDSESAAKMTCSKTSRRRAIIDNVDFAKSYVSLSVLHCTTD